jgi:hypothetical protein
MKLQVRSHDTKRMSCIVAGGVADSVELMHLAANQRHPRHERQKKI